VAKSGDGIEKIKVLFIAGAARSGTTLLERLLGQVKGVFSAGELRYIWERGFKENQLCGCGRPFEDCALWQRIVTSAFGSKEHISQNIDEILSMQASLDRIRFMPFMGYGSFAKILNSFTRELLYPLYSAIQKESGKEIIIDSSKHPSYLAILSRCDFVDLHIVHLIRDSRAVAYSWSKKKMRPEIADRREYMAELPVTRSAFHWLLHNYLIKRFSARHRYIRLRYEDMIAHPRKATEKILSAVSMSDDLSFFTSENRAVFGVNHTVSGNPMRFRNGEIELRLDAEWRDRMGRKDKLLTSFITFPLMRDYFR